MTNHLEEDCPVQCLISKAGSCGQDDMNDQTDIVLSSTVPWTIQADIQKPLGYSIGVCVSCKNIGDYQHVDNFVVKLEPVCNLASVKALLQETRTKFDLYEPMAID